MCFPVTIGGRGKIYSGQLINCGMHHAIVSTVLSSVHIGGIPVQSLVTTEPHDVIHIEGINHSGWTGDDESGEGYYDEDGWHSGPRPT